MAICRVFIQREGQTVWIIAEDDESPNKRTGIEMSIEALKELVEMAQDVLGQPEALN